MRFSLPLTAASVFAFAHLAVSAEAPEFALTLKNHVYLPSELKVPANVKFKLRVTNSDATPEEFESTDFSREAVVLPNRSVVVYVGPLRAGTYTFFGDFHRNTAQGRLLAE